MMPEIQSFDDIERHLERGARVLFLYSGGLDGSYCLARLAPQHADNVIALCVELGGDPLSSAAREVCRTIGVELVHTDRRAEFVKHFIEPAIPAQASYLGGHPISASLSRPLMAQAALETARERGCTVIVHTADASQNSLRRFNGALSNLSFAGAYGSPFARHTVSRAEKKGALAEAGFLGFEDRMFSFDSNLWSREFESGVLDDPETRVCLPANLYRNQGVPAVSGRELSLSFDAGLPVRVDGEAIALIDLIEKLNEIGGQYSLGRYIGLEEVDSGAKVQEAREMPAASILFDAYRRVEAATVAAECIREKLSIEQLWVREAVEGRWFGVLREATQAFILQVAARVSGQVAYRLDNHLLEPLSIRAGESLYIRSRDDLERFRRPAASQYCER